MRTTHDQLVAQAQAGDPVAFEGLHDRYGAAWWVGVPIVPAGEPTVAPLGRDGVRIDDAHRDRRGSVSDGQLVSTTDSRAALNLPGVGHVELSPDTRLRVVDSAGETKRLYLERGKIRAMIVADPRVFRVGTPAGLAIDLGCLHTLEVDGDGKAILHVLLAARSSRSFGRQAPATP